MPINVTARSPGTVLYIPHRAIIRGDRDTTKIRVVYDASANKNVPSLNESLGTDPCLLPKIFHILVRFRGYKYSLTSGIKAAFLNIRIAEEEFGICELVTLTKMKLKYCEAFYFGCVWLELLAIFTSNDNQISYGQIF